MVVRTRSGPRDPRVVPDSLPDDTEESIVGTEWHQEAASSLAVSLAAIAERRAAPWGVCEEVALSGLLHLDSSPYTPRPDVYVLSAPIDASLAEVALAEVGAPLLVVEIGSARTLANDLGDKRIAYEGAGVDEYLVFDPTGEALEEGARGWRVGAEGSYEEWQAARPGEWESRTLEVTFVVDVPFLRVRDRDGWLTPLARRAPLQMLAAERRAEEAFSARLRAEERARQEAAARLRAEERARQEAAARLRAEEALRQALQRSQKIEGAQADDVGG